MTEDLDEIYRRASALDPSRPSETVRRKVLEHAAALAAPPRASANRARWRPAIFGTLAAAALAGLLVLPRFFTPPVAATPPHAGSSPPAELAEAPTEIPAIADALSTNPAPALTPIPPPQAAARSRVFASAGEPGPEPESKVRSLGEATPSTANSSGQGAPRVDAAAPSGAAAQSRAGVQSDRPGGRPATSVQPGSPPTDPSAALRRAAQTGDVQRLRAILGTAVRIDAPDARGQTALMLAASNGQTESVEVLLAQGADPNAADADGTTPLKAALAADHPAIAAALRRAGAR